jgi:cytochrome c-type biogenesis protein CcmH
VAHRAATPRSVLLIALILVAAILASSLAPALVPTAYALNPSERLDDPVLEERAREVSKGLRCVVCQNQSIDDSDAELARDMRVLVRKRIAEGDSNDEVIDYVVSRYGDFVLLKPPLKTSTIGLWMAPILFLLIGIFGAWMLFRNRARTSLAAPLSKEDELKVDAYLREDGPRDTSK